MYFLNVFAAVVEMNQDSRTRVTGGIWTAGSVYTGCGVAKQSLFSQLGNKHLVIMWNPFPGSFGQIYIYLSRHPVPVRRPSARI